MLQRFQIRAAHVIIHVISAEYGLVQIFACDEKKITKMTNNDLVRSIPGARRMWQLYRHRLSALSFRGSADYWNRRYLAGETSGAGSYGELGESKAKFLNAFVAERDVESVIEFGCGDGYQLSLADYPKYLGLDVSRAVILRCEQEFADDTTKSFLLYDGCCFTDRSGWFMADLALSLDVIFHLVEDQIFERYMAHLFAAAKQFVVIYSTNAPINDRAPHVRHRQFSHWAETSCPQ